MSEPIYRGHPLPNLYRLRQLVSPLAPAPVSTGSMISPGERAGLRRAGFTVEERIGS
jgi:hypothetical protein